ncbi:MAG: hypothetical protein AAF449_18845 [Myxococcota bacterium]
MNQKHPGKDFVAAWRALDDQMRSWPKPRGLDERILSASARTGSVQTEPSRHETDPSEPDHSDLGRRDSGRRGFGRHKNIRKFGAFALASVIACIAYFTYLPGSKSLTSSRPKSAASPNIQITQRVMIRFSPKRCQPDVMAPKIELAPGCTAKIDRLDLKMTALEPLQLRRTSAGIEVLDGIGEFEVGATKAAVSLLVSAGRIDIIAARLSIEQSHEVGRIHVERGRGVFVTHEGIKSELRPGDHFDWPGPSRW